MSNKDRLYVALYVAGGRVSYKPNNDGLRYHWALIIVSKCEGCSEGIRYLALEKFSDDSMAIWAFHAAQIPHVFHDNVIMRALVAKIKGRRKLEEILNGVNPESALWISQVIGELRGRQEQKFLAKPMSDWEEIERFCLQYCEIWLQFETSSV